jgi:uroporphyrinogen decarboxylase
MGKAATNRERMLAILAGEILDYVPSWTMGFFDAATIRRLIPADLLVDDLTMWPEEGVYSFESHTPVELNKLIAFNRYIDRIAIGVGRGANHAFGHCGPGEFNAQVIERTAQYRIIQYETGAKARLNYRPHFYHFFDMPVKSVADVEQIVLPDPEDPQRWEGFQQDVAYLKAQGEYTIGYVNGFFSGCHYFFCDYQDLLASLITDPELVERLLAKLGDWNLIAARMMLEAGADCIGFVDDLGSGNNLLFRPELYDRFFFPWHRALCELAHSYGAPVHMHSHGNINKILERVVSTGIDMLNPLDPTEGMDLAAIKERYGQHLTLVGGMDGRIFDQNLEEIEARLQRSVQIGSQGGRFILMDASGIPENISSEKFAAFLEISRRVRRQSLSLG